MSQTSRRSFLGGATLAAGGLAVTRALGDDVKDGHAFGYDAAPSAEFMPLVPRRAGDPVAFTFSLDKGALKATSGGWAREVTARQLPIMTGIAGAHLFMNPGGSREMHWHNSAEWAYILSGHCQATIVDPDGLVEVVNYGPGDLWYFAAGHAHALQTLGSAPCHAVLAFDDGLYSEHGTFGLSDCMSRFGQAVLSQNFGIPAAAFESFPRGETYIMQGQVIALDGPEAEAVQELPRSETHRYRLLAEKPWIDLPGGTIHLASAKEFPASTTITGLVVKLRPGALHEVHWHPHANEWKYVAKGGIRVTLIAADKKVAVAELSPGDCAYIPRGCAHLVQNIGREDCEIVAVHDQGRYHESSFSDWVAKAPSHLLANNLGAKEAALPSFRKTRTVIAAAN
jgi:oxalate decarboxylase